MALTVEHIAMLEEDNRRSLVLLFLFNVFSFFFIFFLFFFIFFIVGLMDKEMIELIGLKKN
jgi:hypothetical protein